jgi:hypothetical protein
VGGDTRRYIIASDTDGLQMAAAGGKANDEDAKREMDRLARDLIPEQMAETQERANDFKPR